MIRGWWLVAALIVVASAPLAVVVLEPPGWVAIPLSVWVFGVLRVGNRLIERDVHREVYGDEATP